MKKVLAVTDIHQDPPVGPDHRAVSRRDVQAAECHGGEQTHGLDDHRLAAGVGTGDQHHGLAGSQLEAQRHRDGTAVLVLAHQGRMAGLPEAQTGPFHQLRGPAVGLEAEPAGPDGQVDPGDRIQEALQRRGVLRYRAGCLLKDSPLLGPDLPVQLLHTVVQENPFHGLHQDGPSTGQGLPPHPLDPRRGVGLHRQHPPGPAEVGGLRFHQLRGQLLVLELLADQGLQLPADLAHLPVQALQLGRGRRTDPAGGVHHGVEALDESAGGHQVGRVGHVQRRALGHRPGQVLPGLQQSDQVAQGHAVEGGGPALAGLAQGSAHVRLPGQPGTVPGFQAFPGRGYRRLEGAGHLRARGRLQGPGRLPAIRGGALGLQGPAHGIEFQCIEIALHAYAPLPWKQRRQLV